MRSGAEMYSGFGAYGVSDAGDEGNHRKTAKLINGGSRADVR
jgi:hypothetical protein